MDWYESNLLACRITSLRIEIARSKRTHLPTKQTSWVSEWFQSLIETLTIKWAWLPLNSSVSNGFEQTHLYQAVIGFPWIFALEMSNLNNVFFQRIFNNLFPERSNVYLKPISNKIHITSVQSNLS